MKLFFNDLYNRAVSEGLVVIGRVIYRGKLQTVAVYPDGMVLESGR